VNLDLTETQSLLRDSLREYLEREVPFDRIRALDRDQTWDERLWRELCSQGWLALASQGCGRGEAGGVEIGILVEELARRAAVVPMAEVAAAARVIERHAEEEVARELLAGIRSGSRRPVPTVPDASDRAAVVVSEDGLLAGDAAFVDYAQFATEHLVVARDSDGVGLFVVDALEPTVAVRPRRSIARTPVASVTYRGTPGRRLAGAAACAELPRWGRIFAAVQCLGCMEQALEMTLRYARIREQFGRPIGSFQAVQHHCANMAMRVASGRFLVYEALSALAGGAEADEPVALAKASVSRAVPEVTMLAHQIHGGNGVIEENDLYFFTLRGKERSLAWGCADDCLATVAANLEAPHEWV
jgi:alkylation response protein AidB-like acyl-CoA dehydrogenase